MWFHVRIWDYKRYFHPESVIREKYGTKNEDFYISFVDLEKTFFRVLQGVVWWALRKLGI